MEDFQGSLLLKLAFRPITNWILTRSEKCLQMADNGSQIDLVSQKELRTMQSQGPGDVTQAAAFDMLMSSIGSFLTPVVQQLINSDPGLVHLKGDSQYCM